MVMCSSRSGGRCRRILPSTPEARPSSTAEAGIGTSRSRDVLDVIARRRMVRSYRREPVSAELIDAVISAAFDAPSAGNTRSLELLVLTETGVADYWDTTLSGERRRGFPWPGLLDAPVLLLPYVDPARYVSRYAEPDKARTGLGVGTEAWTVPYWWVDGGAAVENMLLAANGLSLAGCFFGQFDHEAAVRERFGVPAQLRAIGTVAIGHPDLANDRSSRSTARPKRSVEELTHRGRW